MSYQSTNGKAKDQTVETIVASACLGKIPARVMLNRMIALVAETILPESQCGFKAVRGTVDMIFVARQVQEKCREQKQPMDEMFVHRPTKAVDTVSRESL